MLIFSLAMQGEQRGQHLMGERGHTSMHISGNLPQLCLYTDSRVRNGIGYTPHFLSNSASEYNTQLSKTKMRQVFRAKDHASALCTHSPLQSPGNTVDRQSVFDKWMTKRSGHSTSTLPKYKLQIRPYTGKNLLVVKILKQTKMARSSSP